MNARVLVAALAAAAAAGCYMTSGDGSNPGGPSGPAAPGADAGTPPTTTTASDLPCDVAAVLQSTCTSCHSNPPVGGAPMPLVSYADLTGKALSDPTKTVAERCVVRMQSATTPMPPGGGATSSDIQTLQNWISAGYPQGTCGAGDGGASEYNTPTVCTSGVYRTSNEGSQSMRPGNPCITCHAQSGGEAPSFSIAGTVYPTAHEPNDCVGVGSGVQVVIMDQNGNTQLTLTTNSAGNFQSEASISKPYRAKVVYNGKERAMSATQTDGNCNSCHTESGANGAPGRIMEPK